MNRLKLHSEINSNAKQQDSEDISSKKSPDDVADFTDPCTAFTKEEVAPIAKTWLGTETSEVISGNKVKEINLGKIKSLKLKIFLILQESKSTLIPKVIADCNHLHNQIGVDYRLYALAGEAYIRLQLFSDAENSLLIALALGCNTDAVYCNMASLASMRGDQLLALSWLEKLAAIDPKNENLQRVKAVLFSSGIPQKSKTPYQLNLEQRAPGEFKEK